MQINRWNWLLVILAMVLMVTSCGVFNKKDEARQSYKKAKVGANLEVPPDLTTINPDSAYTIPKAPSAAPNTVVSKPLSTSPSMPGTDVKIDQNETASTTVTTAKVADNLEDTGKGLLPKFSKAHIERDGALRWLVVEQAPEKLWQPVGNFWLNDGIDLVIQNEQTGVVETQWIENEQIANSQAKDAGWLKRLFTRKPKSAPERDKFRVRLARGVKPDTTEIFLTHQRMVLSAGDRAIDLIGLSDQESGAKPAEWVAQPHNPDVEIEVLRLIMVYLGVDKKTTTRVIASAPVLPPDRARLVSGKQGAQKLEMDSEFERAWRRVGVALDRLGFTIEDRNSGEGIYAIRTVEPGAVERKKKKDGFFRKMFSRNNKSPVEMTNLIKVVSVNNLATVQVLSKEGVVDQSANSARILRLLHEQLR